jgi:hypothetical protein
MLNHPYTMTSFLLEKLPDELLYHIIIQVQFSYANFHALNLICKRIYKIIIAGANGKLLEDVAAINFPMRWRPRVARKYHSLHLWPEFVPSNKST